jgi:uncharacterized NAD(P)/FAD-binding protein YdhS
MDGPAGLCTGGPSIAIIGGGFTGAALALHLAAALPASSLLVFEPRPVIGPGLAYSTVDPTHRLNARANRMTLYPDDPTHFFRWIAGTGACLDDPEAAGADGPLFPRRSVFGRYVTAQLAPLLRAGKIIHHQVAANNLIWDRGGWTVASAGATHRADIVILATGHPKPAIPTALTAIAAHPRCIREPLLPGALASIRPTDRVLIAGTGLTMADIVASLDHAGHTGEILAISRRGQSPRPHAGSAYAPHNGIAGADTALALIRQARAAVARAAANGQPWQSVFDALRAQAQTIWLGLPAPERRRIVRHVRPFWECHRHRLPPPTGEVLRRRLDAQTLAISAASIAGAAGASDKIAIAIRLRGDSQAHRHLFDAVIIAAGTGRITEAPGLIENLLRAGLIGLDGAGLGLTSGAGQLFLAGPLTRGTLGEITAVPEIAGQAATIAQHIASAALAAA